MKRLSTGVLAALIAVGFGLTSATSAQTMATKGNIGTSSSASTVAQAMSGMPPADFGTPPSGEVPILFNDHHVYSKPDRLKQGRVLAALVRGNTILVPLRSMFEQMGATVSYDPASKTVDVSKPGSDVKVTVGRPEVIINGESRPLDVPPEIYKGTVVVPVRVISEGMGAYVLWVPSKRVVVVRYVAAPVPTPPPPPPATPRPTPPPTPRPATPAPTLPPTPPPTPTPAPKQVYEHFIVGDYVFHPKVYNEFSNGIVGKNNSYAARGAIEFPAFGLPWMLAGDYRHYEYQHNGTTNPALAGGATAVCPYVFFGARVNAAGDPGCVTVLGRYGQAYVPGFTAQDNDADVRFALKVIDPRIYIGVGYLWRWDNYGYPTQNGVGFGIEKLPDLDQPFSVYGSVWYYPSIKGNYAWPTNQYTTAVGLAGTTGKLEYDTLKYQLGGTFTFLNSQGFSAFIDGGWMGDIGHSKTYVAPSDFNHSGLYLGLGIKF